MPDSPPIWSRAGIELRWREGKFGRANAVLYFGNSYVGGIYNETGLPLGPEHHGPWRAYLMNSDSGSAIGYYETEQECRDALVDAVVKALMGEATDG